MLSVILGILKVIGIVLAAVLLLLLAAALAVLFAAVHYEVQAKKLEEELSARVKISWLLRIISVTVSVRAGAGQELAIRLFGIRLPLFGKRGKKREAQPESCEGVAGENELPEDADSEEQEAQPENYEGGAGENELPKDADIEELKTDREDAADEIEEEAANAEQSGKVEMAALRGAEADRRYDAPPAQEEEADKHSAAPDGADAQDAVSASKINGIAEKTAERIHYLWEKLRAFFSAMQRLLQKLFALPGRIGALLQKPEQLLDLAQRLEIRELTGELWGELLYLLRHYRPRRLSGFLHFGTGDPAATAQLTGLLYLVLPARADAFSLQPEFDEAMLEADVSLRGHIRACHLARVLWRGWRNKKLRRLIKLRKPEYRERLMRKYNR